MSGFPAIAQKLVDTRTGLVTAPWAQFLSGLSSSARAANSIYVNVKDFGAKGDGITNDTAAIQAAINAAAFGSVVVLPPGVYVCSSTITVPVGITLMGLSYAADAGNSGQLGSELIFNAAVLTCISASGGGAAGRVAVRCLTVNRTVAAPAGSIGVLVTASNDPLIEDVYVFKQETGVKINGSLGANLNRVVTTQISGSHHWIASSQETKLHECRFGKNGGLDTNCAQYLRVSGTSDTIMLSQCQLNQSAGTVTNVVLVDTYTSGNGIFTFSECHIEVPAGTTNTFSQVGGSTSFPRITFSATTINHLGSFSDGTIPSGFFAQLTMVGIPFCLPSVTLTGATLLSIAGANFLNAVTISAGNGSVRANFNSALTIGGAMTGMMIDACMTAGSAVTNTATGTYRFNVDTDAVPTPFTPTLDFVVHGDLSVAYTNQIGWYVREGRKITAWGLVSGTPTYTTAGNAAIITGFPFMHSLTADARSLLTGQGITKVNYSEFALDMANGASFAQIVAMGSAQPEAAVTTANIPSGTSFGFAFMHVWMAPH